jgi:nucleoside-diphosphate-sugar epimerase
MHILVTGAAGKLGSAVWRHLRAAGHVVRATDRAPRDGTPEGLIEADLVDPAAVEPLVNGVEAVVHVANHPNVGAAPALKLFGDNTAMNMNVFHAAASAGVRKVVFASSVQAVAGARLARDGIGQPSGIESLPLHGDMPHNPGNIYALSKCVGETSLRYCVDRMGLPSAVAIRYPFLLARERFAHWHQTHASVDAVGANTPLDEGFTWLSYDDAARLALACLARDLPGFRTYYPSHPRPRLAVPLADIVARYYPATPWRAGPRDALIDIAKITAETGWAPQDDYTAG